MAIAMQRFHVVMAGNGETGSSTVGFNITTFLRSSVVEGGRPGRENVSQVFRRILVVKTNQSRQWRRVIIFLSSGLLACSAMLVPGQVVAADDIITFSTAPTQSITKTRELYGPLAEYMSQASGKKVELVPARNFLEYTSKMRKREYDIIFDGPHFVAWRMQHIKHIPIARLPGELVFMAAVKDGGVITGRKQLIGKKVCAVNSPNLATLMLLDALPNPLRQPVIVSRRSFKDAMSCLKEGKGVAAFLPIKFWKKFEKMARPKVSGFFILQRKNLYRHAPLPFRIV